MLSSLINNLCLRYIKIKEKFTNYKYENNVDEKTKQTINNINKQNIYLKELLKK